MSGFVRFPRTPHLSVLGSLDVRDDKVMSPQEASAFLSQDIIVEEKIDGENLGLSAMDGRVLAQSRGSFVEPGGTSFRGLAAWLQPRASQIVETLGEDLVLFGEWCASRHSVFYEALPDWLLVFDIYDRRKSGFWSVDERNQLVETLSLVRVPELAIGRFELAALEAMLGPSRFSDEQMEGLVLRHPNVPDDRAKMVRPEFSRAIGTHWRSRRPERNRLAARARTGRAR